MSSDFYQQDRRGRWRRTAAVQADAAERRKRLPLWIGAAVAVVLVVAGAAFVIVRANSGPQAIASRYCQAIMHQDYAGAYSLFASSFQGLVSAEAYAASMRALDSQRGVVTHCSVGTVGQASATDLLSRAKGGTETARLQFANGSNSGLTAAPDLAVMPLAATYQFCQSLASSDFGGAYNRLSANFQQSAGPSNVFQDDARASVQVTGAVKGCHLQDVYLSGNARSATVKFGIDFERFTNMPAQISAIGTDAATAWHVDSMNFTAAGVSLPFPLPLTKVRNVLNILKTICSLAPPNQVCTIIDAIPS